MSRRVMICSNFYPPDFVGGAEIIAHYQALALKSLGHDVHVFSGHYRSNDRPYTVRTDEHQSLTVHRINLPADLNQDVNINFHCGEVENNFQDLLEQCAPDVVHMHNLKGLSLGIIALAKRAGARVVMTLHDNWYFCPKGTTLRNNETICYDYGACDKCLPLFPNGKERNISLRMRRDYFAMNLDLVDAFISPSRCVADNYIAAGFATEKIKVIWNGIEVRRFALLQKADNRGVMRFTFLGYVGRHKGIHVLLDALRYMDRRHKIILNIVGTGEDLYLAKKQVKSIGRKDTVRFWGKVHNDKIQNVFLETDVLVVPSIWPENQPVTITEAMASRVPVIASNIGGIPELVEDGITGYLFDTGNPIELARRMTECIENPEEARARGENGFNKIRGCTFEAQVEKILRVYDGEPGAIPVRRRTVVRCAASQRAHLDVSAFDAVMRGSGRDVCFVLDSWINEEDSDPSFLAWVLDEHVPLDALESKLMQRTPLLVPENSRHLKQFCMENNCGLYYRDMEEALECIRYLIGHRREAAIMGNNGYKAIMYKKNRNMP
ncbi:MAG: glycosyltransferase [Spirochaetes bacterium]|nr:glycosyltransferase [Spirochaetota bacterium]